MNFRQSKSSSLLLPIALVIAIFTLIFLVSSSYRQIRTLSESEKLVQHSQKVHLELEQLISCVKDAETGQRGYILTQNPVFLKPYTTAHPKVKHSIQQLKILTSDAPIQRENVKALEKLIEDEFINLDATLKNTSFDIRNI
ncbi:CHASE3 domain-containing protein [Flavobacterium sp. 3HN19-14]|uniref:CHASE3 domain-containing protein n=1 Tax=Flavobacterium sp. 3HN19-14 TaxID=3448133 RepID=UPI003EE25D17